MTPTQADREAAEAIYDKLCEQFQVRRIKAMAPDDDDLVQAFTRHRLAAEAAAFEKAAGVVKKSARGYNEEDEFERGFACACTMLSIQLGQLAGEKHD